MNIEEMKTQILENIKQMTDTELHRSFTSLVSHWVNGFNGIYDLPNAKAQPELEQAIANGRTELECKARSINPLMHFRVTETIKEYNQRFEIIRVR